MRDRYKGCLLGLSVGDALGAPVEFLSIEEIKDKYGEEGISDFDSWSRFSPGSYTDDTQLSLATARGCIETYKVLVRNGGSDSSLVVYREYLKWLETQKNPYQVRVPGYTTLSALQSGKIGSMEIPLNHSKGSGAVMRTAPVGLAYPSEMAFREGAQYAALTHGHPSGYLPAGFLSELIAKIIEGVPLEESIHQCQQTLFQYDDCEETGAKVKSAVEFFRSQKPDEESLSILGEGWVGEESLAVGLYCSLKYRDDFRKGVITAVNHSGDSDTTGNIAGAILGMLLGMNSIPEKWILKLENTRLIEQTADEMYEIFQQKPKAIPWKR